MGLNSEQTWQMLNKGLDTNFVCWQQCAFPKDGKARVGLPVNHLNGSDLYDLV